MFDVTDADQAWAVNINNTDNNWVQYILSIMIEDDQILVSYHHCLYLQNTRVNCCIYKGGLFKVWYRANLET